MRSRILFLPVFDRIEELQDTLARAAFHLGRAEPERLTFLLGSIQVDDANHLLDDFTAPDGIDSEIGQLVEGLAKQVDFVSGSSQGGPHLLAVHDIVAVWDGPAFDSSLWVVERGVREDNRSIFDVDHRDGASGGMAYAYLADLVSPSRPSVENRRFDKMLRTLPQSRQSYLFGPGPSLRDALGQDFSNGIRIVGNRAVLDDEIMDQVQPHVVAIADPVRDFGPSSDAEVFRAALRRRLAIEPALHAVVPLPFRSLIASMMPEHESRLVGIPLLPPGSGMSIDLRSRFGVLAFPDALTMMMLPIAASISGRIGLVGFDGRNSAADIQPDDGAKVAVDDDKSGAQTSQPGLPGIDDEDADESHSASIVSIVQACEARGIVVESISQSQIRPLARRHNVLSHNSVGWEAPVLDEDSSTVLVSIDPDWDGNFGHYGPWYRTLAAECKTRGIPTVSLASRALTPPEASVLPTFSYPTTNRMAATTYRPQFEIELNSAVDRLLTAYPDRKLKLFFYCADVWHLPSLIRLRAKGEGRVEVHVNLMRAHPFVIEAASDPSDSIDPRVRAFNGLLDSAQDAGVHVSVDTEQLHELVRDLSGAEVSVIPMAAAAEVGYVDRPPPDKLLVYCPALSQVVKGSIDFARAAASLAAGDLSTRARFRMRLVRQPGGLPDNLVREVEAAEDAGVEVLRGSMTDARYSSVIEEADIVVVPYRATAFRTRTSAAIVDAIRAGKPVVAASGTWGDSVLQSTNTSVSFRSGDFEDLARAITEGVNRFDQLSVRARTAAVDAHEQYSIAALVDHIFASAPRQPTSDPALWLTRVVDLEAILESHVLALQHGMRSARAAMTKAHDAAVSEQGRADDLRDRNDQLTLALQAGELRNSDLAAAIDGATSTVKETKRELEAATRDLATLKRDYETATGDREAATRDLATLSRDHETATRDLEAATRDLEAAMRDLDAATRELNTLRLDQESTTRDLDAAHRQLTDVEIELGAASARELRANRKIENLSHSVEVLEGGFTNRAFAAMKRVIKP